MKAILELIGGRLMAEQLPAAAVIWFPTLTVTLPAAAESGPIGGWVFVDGPDDDVNALRHRLGSRILRVLPGE